MYFSNTFKFWIPKLSTLTLPSFALENNNFWLDVKFSNLLSCFSTQILEVLILKSL